MKIGDKVYIVDKVLEALLHNKNFSDAYYHLITVPHWIVVASSFYKKKTLQDLFVIGRNECTNVQCRHEKCVEEILLFPPSDLCDFNVCGELTSFLQLPSGVVKKIVSDQNDDLDYIVRSRACPFCFDKKIYAKLGLSKDRKYLYCNENSNHFLKIDVEKSLALVIDPQNYRYGYDMKRGIVKPISFKDKRIQHLPPIPPIKPLDVGRISKKLKTYITFS